MKEYWLDTDLMRFLGIADFRSFRSLVNKAMHDCTGQNIDPLDDFVRHVHTAGDGTRGLYKFSRFACRLIARHAGLAEQDISLFFATASDAE